MSNKIENVVFLDHSPYKKNESWDFPGGAVV